MGQAVCEVRTAARAEWVDAESAKSRGESVPGVLGSCVHWCTGMRVLGAIARQVPAV